MSGPQRELDRMELLNRLAKSEEERKRREIQLDEERRAEIQKQLEMVGQEIRAREAQAEQARIAKDALEKEKSWGHFDRLY